MPDLAQRLEWAHDWAARISATLDTPAKNKTTAQRLWRMRYFQDDDYLVVTMLQQMTAPPGVPSDQAIKVALILIRPYHKSNLSGGSVMQMQLAGQYSVDEIVSFLRLDTVDPTSAEFVDETKYGNILVVGDMIRQHVRAD